MSEYDPFDPDDRDDNDALNDALFEDFYEEGDAESSPDPFDEEASYDDDDPYDDEGDE